ncbi:hypothetical protein T4A_384 [Trichinella pseudospiralis]|uniref:Uncharacterized protein n=1 Tax=Trichinella pseudospiralis TaxID=6337 RepID=A0A0V1EAG8_TRIPS|nr:hypothetical protein T4A_384 [Trichinella pseudospiralis]
MNVFFISGIKYIGSEKLRPLCTMAARKIKKLHECKQKRSSITSKLVNYFQVSKAVHTRTDLRQICQIYKTHPVACPLSQKGQIRFRRSFYIYNFHFNNISIFSGIVTNPYYSKLLNDVMKAICVCLE